MPILPLILEGKLGILGWLFLLLLPYLYSSPSKCVPFFILMGYPDLLLTGVRPFILSYGSPFMEMCLLCMLESADWFTLCLPEAYYYAINFYLRLFWSWAPLVYRISGASCWAIICCWPACRTALPVCFYAWDCNWLLDIIWVFVECLIDLTTRMDLYKL